MDALSIILQLLEEELEVASQLIKALFRIELVELYNKEQQPRLYNKLYKLYKIYKVYYVPYVPYIPYIAKGFLRYIDVYLRRTTVPTRQFSLCSNSQNIIGVNLLGNHSTSYVTTLLIIYSSFLYTQPINRTYYSIPYKVPLYNYYYSYSREE